MGGLVLETNNCKHFHLTAPPPPYCCEYLLSHYTLTAAMLYVGTKVESELCALA